MSKIYQPDPEKEYYMLYCPGCNRPHAFGSGWEFNKDFDKPTINPSLGISYPPEPFHCHSFVKAGLIHFLTDSKHELAGQTVELPEYPDNYK